MLSYLLGCHIYYFILLSSPLFSHFFILFLAGAVLNSVGNVADHVSNTAAGTVRTVGNVASGIGGAIGTVADVTAQTIRDIPSDIRGTLADTRESISQDFQTAREAAGMLGQFAQNTLPMIPPLHQAWNPAAWREQYSAYGSQFDNAYGALEGTLESIAEGISAKYCTEAVYVPKTKEPAEFTGPGFSITFLTGECSIDEKALLCKFYFILLPTIEKPLSSLLCH